MSSAPMFLPAQRPNSVRKNPAHGCFMPATKGFAWCVVWCGVWWVCGILAQLTRNLPNGKKLGWREICLISVKKVWALKAGWQSAEGTATTVPRSQPLVTCFAAQHDCALFPASALSQECMCHTVQGMHSRMLSAHHMHTRTHAPAMCKRLCNSYPPHTRTRTRAPPPQRAVRW
jgi:hypothetical protein